MTGYESPYRNCPLCGQLHDDGGIYIVTDGTKEYSLFFCMDCDEDRRAEVARYILDRYTPVMPSEAKLREEIDTCRS